ncbi:MAG: phosphate ABC transporter substrate-binding protein PstS [Anaerolineae bacterium]|nr:phosphate ABC transporter substrate-binding protein PstS [Anaerolineae bacterium]
MFKTKTLVVGLLISLLVLVVAACATATPTPQPTPTPLKVVETKVVEQTKVVEKVVTATPAPLPTATPAPKAGSILINGAGATFPYPLYSRWFYEYAFVDTTVRFNYQSIGSGGGIAQITAKTVDFGASDAILTDEQYAKAPGIQMIPIVAGAIVPIYNIRGEDGRVITDTIRFPRTALVDIYLGKIKKWNDPVLVQANPNFRLPNKDIVVVARADGSGTTFAYTDYLSQVSAEWKEKVGMGTSVKWPTALGGRGNEGVAGTVTQNDGAIGYVEFAYAKQNRIPFGAVQNKAGEYVLPTVEAVQSAMADFGTNMGEKLALSIADAPGKNSWPIASYTYLLIYMDQTDCVKGKKVIEFIKWGLSDEGSKFARELDYIPLPPAVRQAVLDKLNKVTCQGKPL